MFPHSNVVTHANVMIHDNVVTHAHVVTHDNVVTHAHAVTHDNVVTHANVVTRANVVTAAVQIMACMRIRLPPLTASLPPRSSLCTSLSTPSAAATSLLGRLLVFSS